MKKARTINKKVALALSIIMLIGLLPLNIINVNAISSYTPDAMRIAAGITAQGVSVGLVNDYGVEMAGKIVLATYDAEGKLAHSAMKPFRISPESLLVENVVFDYDFTVNPNNIIKIFVWTNGDNNVPICMPFTSATNIIIDGSDVEFDGRNVIGDSSITEFKYVSLNEFTRRGVAYQAKKIDEKWEISRADYIDVIIAYAPRYSLPREGIIDNTIGGALPEVALTELPMPNGIKTMRVVISLHQ